MTISIEGELTFVEVFRSLSKVFWHWSYYSISFLSIWWPWKGPWKNIKRGGGTGQLQLKTWFYRRKIKLPYFLNFNVFFATNCILRWKIIDNKNIDHQSLNGKNRKKIENDNQNLVSVILQSQPRNCTKKATDRHLNYPMLSKIMGHACFLFCLFVCFLFCFCLSHLNRIVFFSDKVCISGQSKALQIHINVCMLKYVLLTL